MRRNGLQVGVVAVVQSAGVFSGSKRDVNNAKRDKKGVQQRLLRPKRATDEGDGREGRERRRAGTRGWW